MKKQSIYALMSAIALSGAIGFSSCSSDDKVEVNPNPGYNSSTGDVPVNFVFNVSTNSQGKTRMSAASVQEDYGDVIAPFRGIQNAKIYSFKTGNDGQYITSGETQTNRIFDLDLLIDAGALKGEGKPQSRRVLEMSFPTETNTLMLWGRAYRAPMTSSTDNPDAIYGGIDFVLNDNFANNSFKIKPCVPIDNSEKGDQALAQYERLIEHIINSVITAHGPVNVTKGGKTVNKEMKWTDYVDINLETGAITVKSKDPSTYVSESDCNNMCALGEILGKLFVDFNTFKDDELRNGEGKITAALMGDIYSVLETVLRATTTTAEEEAAQDVARKIETVIADYFSITTSGDVSTASWRATSTIISKATSSGFLGSTDLINQSLPATDNFRLFPNGIFHLPPGSTVMKYIARKKDPNNPNNYIIANEYKFMDEVPTYAMGNVGGSFNPKNYMYPAELCYFGNSPIRETNDVHEVDQYPDGVANWDNDDKWLPGAEGYSWIKNSHVKSSTRSVAMQENINYGTSMLQTTVKYGAATLKDNNSILHPGEEENTIDINAESFQLTGILIGGMVQEVGWDYTAKGESGTDNANFNCMVYDDQIVSKVIPAYGSGSTIPNYTLVWDNWDAEKKGNDQRSVFVALQFLNNAKNFWGRNNLIRKGATFYIVGQLDPTKTSQEQLSSLGITADEYKAQKDKGIIWPDKYALPPYDNGATIKERRVFIQDYKTVANFTIGENSLQSALVSVPDLRQAQLTLGLSVDLSWRNGLTFDVELGKNE